MAWLRARVPELRSGAASADVPESLAEEFERGASGTNPTQEWALRDATREARRFLAGAEAGALSWAEAGALGWLLAWQARRLLADRAIAHWPTARRAAALRVRADIWATAARCLEREGDPARAGECYALALDDAAEDGTPSRDEATWLGRGRCLLALGRADDALLVYRRAEMALADEPGPFARARTLLGQGTALRAAGRALEARGAYEAALHTLERSGQRDAAEYAQGLGNLANCYLLRPSDRGTIGKAVALAEDAARRFNSLGHALDEARCLHTVGTARRLLGEMRAARERYLSVEDRCGAFGPEADDLRWRVGYNLAVLDRQIGRWAEARAQLRTVLPICERLARLPSGIEDRLSQRESLVQAFRLAVDTDVRLGELDPVTRERHWCDAWRAIQEAKGRIVADLVAGATGDPRIGGDTAAPSPATLAEVRAALRPGEALLDALNLDLGGEGEPMLALLLLSGERLHARLVPLGEVEAALAAWDAELERTIARRRLRKLLPEDSPESLALLYRLLLGPWARAGLLAEISDLVVIPSGPLHRVPFPALWHGSPGRRRWLIDDHYLSYVPAATALVRARRRPPPDTAAPNLLALAPSAAAERPRPLPATRREVAVIARLVRATYPGAVVCELHDDEATLDAALRRLPAATIVVAATHGRGPASSDGLAGVGLEFAPWTPEGEPTLLKLRDLYGGALALGRAFQVSLTGCHLGRAHGRGEEALGFVQALLGAGVRLCLAPLWEVDDGAMAHLSIAYHRALVLGQTAAESYRSALQAVRSLPGLRHPYFWAGLILAGDASLRLPPDRSAGRDGG